MALKRQRDAECLRHLPRLLIIYLTMGPLSRYFLKMTIYSKRKTTEPPQPRCPCAKFKKEGYSSSSFNHIHYIVCHDECQHHFTKNKELRPPKRSSLFGSTRKTTFPVVYDTIYATHCQLEIIPIITLRRKMSDNTPSLDSTAPLRL